MKENERKIYLESAMKSITCGIVSFRERSAMKMNEPFKIPMTTNSFP